MKHLSFEISNNWEDHKDLKVSIPWETAHPNSKRNVFKAKVKNKQWLIRLNDFPDYPLFTLLVEDNTSHDTPQGEVAYFDEIIHFDDWPEFWGKRPDFPEHLPKQDSR